MSPEKSAAVAEEVERLLNAGFIRKANYPRWVSNVVMVKKANGQWRMCVDFKDVNNACPKDSFPLPKIDTLVDSTAGHEALSFMDAFSGYNQVKLNPDDQELTTFVTDRGLYCYTVMPFGVKNGCATFQRLVNEIFKGEIGKTVEVYIDDILVKSCALDDHAGHLKQALERLRRAGMKLNPEKCVFGAAAGKFLGFLISQRGIEANPIKIRALEEVGMPRTVRDVQALAGRIAALNRFISKSTDKCAPFFEVIKRVVSGGAKHVEWPVECQEALRAIKEYMGKAPLLATPEPVKSCRFTLVFRKGR